MAKRLLRPTALARLKETYRTKGTLLPELERHVMKSLKDNPERSHDWLHPSDLCKSDWCGRHDYYRIIGTPPEKVSKGANPSFRMENIFAEGHAIHGKYQGWFQEMGVLYGTWRCKACGERFESLSPSECPTCHSDRLTYKELTVRRQSHMVEGHADAAIHAPWYRGLVEIKSIGVRTWAFEAPRLYQRYLNGESAEDLWIDIKRPFPTHMRQGQLYLWMAWPRYEQIIFIYESKFHQQTKEFVVPYNRDLIATQLEGAKDVAQGVRAGITPDRPYWAEDPESKVCASCVYRMRCWELNGATDGPTKESDPATVTIQRGSSYKRRRALRSA
jgi:hypothetical protein